MDLTEIGARFKEARHQSRRTQSELSRALGMSRATLSALESGRGNEIGVRKLTALLESVGLDLYVAPQLAGAATNQHVAQADGVEVARERPAGMTVHR
jgi:HTH-type transcriptional regulator / antitoxin HipB